MEIELDFLDRGTLLAFTENIPSIMVAMPFWTYVPIKWKQGIANRTTDPTTPCDCLSDVGLISEIEPYATTVRESF